MKKTLFYFTILASIFFTACQKENQQEDAKANSATLGADWLNAKLDAHFSQSQQKVS